MSHLFVDPPGLPKAVGFSHAAVAHEGKTVYLAGQAGHRPDGTIGPDLLDQFSQACQNVAVALEGTGASRDDLVSLYIFRHRRWRVPAPSARVGRSVSGGFRAPLSTDGPLGGQRVV